jgi:transposase
MCRWLRERGVVVVEVDRPDRKLRRNAGKSDPIDAEAAARKVLSGEATVTPRSGGGRVEMIRVVRLTRLLPSFRAVRSATSCTRSR